MISTSSRNFYTFKNAPDEDNYYDLIDCALEKVKCKFCFLIVRKSGYLNSSGQNAIQSLEPFFIEILDVSEWPGTKLLWDTAKLYKYNFCPELVIQLKKLSHDIFDWKLPDLPEDLSLMLDENTPWLFSITHERDIVLFLSEDEVNYLISKKGFSSMLIVDEKYNKEN